MVGHNLASVGGKAMVAPIEFGCPSCRRRLRTPAEFAGKPSCCPMCQSAITVPMASLPEVSNNSVPMGIRLPNNLGGLETTVSRKTADGMAQTMLGGLLVVVGVIICGMFGIRMNRS